MNESLAVSIALCYQFESKYYDSSELKSCITQATQYAEDMLSGINMVFDDIEDAMHHTQVHENVTEAIRKSHIIIFEISDLNHNVIYELGVANTLKKPIIILREKTSENPLPADINQFIYIEYEKNKLEELSSVLAKRIKKAYKNYDETAFVPKRVQKKIIDSFISNNSVEIFQKLDSEGLVRVLKSKKDFQKVFEDIVASTKVNFYYMGTMGFLSSSNQWMDIYKKYFDKNKVFSRIVYLKTLKEFHEIYDDEEMLVNYCLWLSQNYYMLKEKIISINHSEDVGIWKNGMSIVVSDEEKLLIATGSFRSEYNSRGILIQDANISQIFKEYTKVLSVKSKSIRPRGMLKYFSFNEKVKQLPVEIEDIFKSGKFDDLRKACESYIDKCLDTE
jgi:nucleoside 2-deoxyribosyltransferase